jgi:hypothetical protein
MNLERTKMLSAVMDCVSKDDLNGIKNTWAQYGCNLSINDKLGNWTLMFHAAGKGHVKIMEWLKSQGASIYTKDEMGNEPIHNAVQNGELESVKWLVKQGANINAKGLCDYTPICIAILYGFVEIVKWLKEQGANTNIRTSDGKTPLDLANDKGIKEIIRLLDPRIAEEERKEKERLSQVLAQRAEEERKKKERIAVEQERLIAEQRAEEERSQKFKESGKMEFSPQFLKEFVKGLEIFNADCDSLEKTAAEKNQSAIAQGETLKNNLLQSQKNGISAFVSSKQRAFGQYQQGLAVLASKESTREKEIYDKITECKSTIFAIENKLGNFEGEDVNALEKGIEEFREQLFANKESIRQERDKLYSEYQEECKKIVQSRKEKQGRDDKERGVEDKKRNDELLEFEAKLKEETFSGKTNAKNQFTSIFKHDVISENYMEIYNADPLLNDYKTVTQKKNPFSAWIGSLTYNSPNVGQYAKKLLETFYPFIYRHNDLRVPFCINISDTNGIYFEQTNANRSAVYVTMQSLILKLLLQIQPGLLKLTLYDGEGSGKNLIGLSHIDKRIKGENILTDQGELKRALEAAVSDMNTTIQKVLGPKFADKTLMDYNEIAGKQAKAYHIICITDFPHGLTKEHLELINKIVRSGKQAGMFIIMGSDTEYSPKNTFERLDTNPLLQEMTVVELGDLGNNLSLQLSDYFPDHDLLEKIQEYINSELKKAGKVEVKLDGRVGEDKLWQSDSRSGIDTPIGQLNITDLQHFVLSVEDGSSDTPHHCLIGGATGSGKTVLLHNIICWTAWNYSPDEVQFVLLDYKEGTEFKVYESLPHAKVLSIHSEREYGISVLEYISAEIERRGKKFKEVNAQNIATYREKTGEIMPRLLVIIDEFQVLLNGDMKTSTFVSKALDDIGRRGRSFGINLILSSQSLSGVDISQTLSHLGLRIALKLNTEKDCDMFLGQGNHVPFKALQKKGEAVYNARSGLPEGNVRFQVAYLSDKDLAAKITTLQEKTVGQYGSNLPQSVAPRFLFDGEVSATFAAPKEYTPDHRKCKVYVGEPVALEAEHSSFTLLRQNESNVLVVGQDICAAMSIFKHSVRQIVPQSTDDCKVYICNKVNMDNDHYGKLDSLPDEFGDKVNLLEDDPEIQRTIESIFEEVEKRKVESNKNRIILAFADIYNVRALRKSGYSDSPLTQKLVGILKDGPGLGVHCIIHASSFDNFKNVLDVLSMLNEFNVRIELRGGDGYKIFQSNEVGIEKATPDRENVANIQTAQMNGIRKIKVYSF